MDRRLYPLFDELAEAPLKATLLKVKPCKPEFAIGLNQAWHSRLPYAQRGPWILAFAATYRNNCFGVALWHNPSARNLPQDWLELRRLAVPLDAPHCTCSYMLGKMRLWIKSNMPQISKLISYQDIEVHTGTIYLAAGWTPAWIVRARVRDRSKPRQGTRRNYRCNSNGEAPDGSGKIRWEMTLGN